MKRKAGLTLFMTLTCLLLSAFPVMAGEWHETDRGQWQYIQDDGTKATGWLQLEDKCYWMDNKGNRRCNYWVRDNGEWYYVDEDGVLVTDAWVDNYYVDKDGKMIKKR
ncbi:MAG: hypothetical protein ACRDBO_02950 [Lachnospiraceae bacterium]